MGRCITVTSREVKGLQIAATSKLSRDDNNWLVPSQSSGKKYKVVYNDESPECTCPDFEYRKQPCKHIMAVEYTIKREFHEDGSETTTETVKVTYKQDWKSYNAAQTNEKDYFQVLLADLCKTLPEPVKTIDKSKGGRPPLPFSDMTFSAIYKVYSSVSARRFASDLRGAQENGYIGKTPHFNSVLNHLEREDLTPILNELIMQSSKPLAALESQFAADSSGFSTSKLVNYYDSTYKQRYQESKFWIKCHLMCGVRTNIVTACRISGNGDAAELPDLLETTARNFQVDEVSADKGYSSRRNLQVISDLGAMPYIMFKKDTIMRKDSEIWNKMFHYFSFNREDFLSHYHQRSNVESTFAAIKAKFGGYVKSKTLRAQMNEVYCKVLCHNISVLIHSIFELGINPSFCADLTVAQKPSLS